MIFCAVFLLSEILCLFFQKAYAIRFNLKTVIVLFSGFFAFTFVHLYLAPLKKPKRQIIKNHEIKIPSWFLYMFIAFQIIAIIAFVVYLHNISDTYDGKARSLGELINLYDTMTKFWQTEFRALEVTPPMIYRVLNPFVHAWGYMSVYIAVNNYYALKKIDWRFVISSVLLCILIFLNGSRSPLLRIMTMIVILVYIFSYRNGKLKTGDMKLLIKLAAIAIPAVLVLLLLVRFMRPNVKISNLGNYIFIYAGAPLVNLNNWLAKFNGIPNLHLIGSQTFRNLYNYLGKWTGDTALETYKSINEFAYSANGIEIGNVRTCFYFLLYDFSYLGPVIMIALMAYYYVFEYMRCMYSKSLKGFDLRLFIYSYLINDLIMSFFSTRFYETVVSPDFLKFFLAVMIVSCIYAIQFNHD